MIVPVVAVGQSTQAVETISGTCTVGDPVSASVIIDFTPTGGDFFAGTGTATVDITLENTSGLIPFQLPAVGNPVLTSFLFNIPATASAALIDAALLAGSALVSTGTTMDGFPIPAGCTVLGVDVSHSTWYELQSGSSAGQYGIFTNSLETDDGIKAGLVDPEVYPACVAQGDVFSPLVVAGQVRFTLSLGNLDISMDSADDFASNCSLVSGENQPVAFGAKFQGTNIDGEDSCFIGEPGDCQPVPTEATNWGEIKSKYE